MVTDWLDPAADFASRIWDGATETVEDALDAIWLAFVAAAFVAFLLHFGPIILVWVAGAPHWIVLSMLLGLWLR
jgi:hypothetical protein